MMASQMAKKTDQSEKKRNDPVKFSKHWCIYRIPSKLRNVKDEAYTPQLISIGPFHHGNPKLADMESHKKKYYENFCQRTSRKKEELETFIREKEDDILRCYAGSIEPDIDFVKVILIDACFILELFLRNCQTEKHENYYILRSPLLRKAVEQDLILFENQLPYPLLQGLYDFANPTYSSSNPRKNVQEKEEADDLQHCLPCFQPCFPFSDATPSRLRKPKSIYDVRKLKEAGVKFRPNEGSERFVIKRGEDHKCNFKMACFRNMNLKLTKFWARYEVECVIRNVMALEQFLYPKKAYVCSYFLMLDQLVDTVEDVNALIESEVIVNLLGSSNAVAKLINSLCEQTMDDRSCYEDICKQLNEHYKISFCNRNISILKRVYFKDLWTGSSTIVGLFVLFFSIIGTIKSLM
ncbi:LOW QUALITY PROTEIN: hypothetical protein PRUPE_2G124800 [Prunus persica]|uniref:Uncharacterized protein n=1 Tax=Prunus persica TaxID=3760 RepID=A0A251QF28_PRUPE|nr:LOW QUALITY PROTEIN: hypothetical protein PRUPE_2G124800 [Prunus persica]